MLSPLQHIAAWLQEQLIAELEAQDHVASGKLRESVEVVVEEITGGFRMQGRYIYYGRYVDTGRPAGIKRVPIDALIDWIRHKRIDLRGRTERSVAFAIQTAIFQKGVPTDGDQRKKRWVSRTLEEKEEELVIRIREAAEGMVDILMDNLIENTKKEFASTAAA